VKSNKQDNAAISKRVKKELLEMQSSQSEYFISIETLLIASLRQVQNQMKKSLLPRSNNLQVSAIALL